MCMANIIPIPLWWLVESNYDIMSFQWGLKKKTKKLFASRVIKLEFLIKAHHILTKVNFYNPFGENFVHNIIVKFNTIKKFKDKRE